MSQHEEAEVIIGQDDWEKFLSSIERLMSLHQRTFQRLTELGRRNQALRIELRDAVGLRSLDIGKREPKLPIKSVRSGFLGRVFGLRQTSSSFDRDLHQPAAPLTGLAMCGKCGYQLKRPSLFCECCGGSFGVLVCRCGRELAPNDKFCDSCGQKVLGYTALA